MATRKIHPNNATEISAKSPSAEPLSLLDLGPPVLTRGQSTGVQTGFDLDSMVVGAALVIPEGKDDLATVELRRAALKYREATGDKRPPRKHKSGREVEANVYNHTRIYRRAKLTPAQEAAVGAERLAELFPNAVAQGVKPDVYAIFRIK